MNIDAIDRKLLNLLRLDARRPNNALAAEVGLSPSACLRRVRLLEDAGVIRGYTVVTRAERTGGHARVGRDEPRARRRVGRREERHAWDGPGAAAARDVGMGDGVEEALALPVAAAGRLRECAPAEQGRATQDQKPCTDGVDPHASSCADAT